MDSKTAMGKFRRITGITPKLDGEISVISRKLVVDMLALDNQLAKADPEYDAENCTYKGKSDYSMQDYIREKWGDDTNYYVRVMCDLLPKNTKL